MTENNQTTPPATVTVCPMPGNPDTQRAIQRMAAALLDPSGYAQTYQADDGRVWFCPYCGETNDVIERRLTAMCPCGHRVTLLETLEELTSLLFVLLRDADQYAAGKLTEAKFTTTIQRVRTLAQQRAPDRLK